MTRPQAGSPDLQCGSPAVRASLALASVPGLGGVRCRELLERHGTADHALVAALTPGERERALENADLAIARAGACGARVLVPDDGEYPATLADLPDPPPVLFALGDVRVLTPPVVAIVGTRNATPYGERVTREIAGALARAGACVVSGLARGVDAAAHRGALQAGGHTAAVLGTGVDVAYPAAHKRLHAELGARGLLLSEHHPGDRASAGSFPRRNRIVAALASATIVVEAGARSGALITASHALELGRVVAAVPGPIDVPQSAGANELLRDGAVVLASVADALALVGLTLPPRRPAATASPAEEAVWTALAHGPLDADSITARAGLPARECLAAITALELSGAIECALTGEIRRR